MQPHNSVAHRSSDFAGPRGTALVALRPSLPPLSFTFAA